jgi:DNA-binding HxlR family transcriptional regulator
VILGTLSDGPASFRVLARAVPGISDSMLSTRLAALTNAGLLTRAVDEGPPVSVGYQLTHAGRALLPALEQISRWADEHLSVGQLSAHRFLPGRHARGETTPDPQDEIVTK